MGLWKEFIQKPIQQNPVFVLVLGLCPTLAVSTSLANGVAMACAATGVLICSNVLISLIRKFIPNQIRIACFIVVIAGFVTMCEIIMKALAPEAINKALGIFIPLIVVNCIILGRAEAYASQHGPLASMLDGLGVGVGYLLSLGLISFIREVLGAGTLWGYRLTPVVLGGTTVIPEYTPAAVLGMAPGAFIIIGLLFGLFYWIGNRRREAARCAAVPAVPQVARDFPKPPKEGAEAGGPGRGRRAAGRGAAVGPSAQVLTQGARRAQGKG
ncbi:MAG: electron transport complex subunit E [Planctomycetes bacterium]|nr:electron transport complex subunit E [Planctomycetota bacterium]